MGGKVGKKWGVDIGWSALAVEGAVKRKVPAGVVEIIQNSSEKNGSLNR